jgi:predicted metal-binding membrane protein
MPGGWTMSMTWMRMPGQSWLGAAGMFIGMWVVMMIAMMLPPLMPTLWRYRRSIRGLAEGRLSGLTALAGAGYFFVWAGLGAVAYILGCNLTAAEMRWVALARYVPVATGAVLVLAGWFQFTAWKARRLGRCRDVPACGSPSYPSPPSAWRTGLGWGVDCGLCCCGFMLVLLVTGVMNLAAMATLATAITIERLVPKPERAARAAGIAMIATGAYVMERAIRG